MRQNPVSEIFDIPQYGYFEFGNPFSGSLGSLSYRITPGEQLTVQVWHSRLCAELAEIDAQRQFPMDADGFREMLRWLEEQPTPEDFAASPKPPELELL